MNSNTMINKTDVFPVAQNTEHLEVMAVLHHKINNEGQIQYLVEFADKSHSWMINTEGYEMVVVKYFENKHLNSLIVNKKRKYKINGKRKMDSSSSQSSKKRKLNTK